MLPDFWPRHSLLAFFSLEEEEEMEALSPLEPTGGLPRGPAPSFGETRPTQIFEHAVPSAHMLFVSCFTW